MDRAVTFDSKHFTIQPLAEGVFASTRTRDLLATSGTEELEWYVCNSPQRLASLREQLVTASDDLHAREQQIFMWEFEGIVESLPDLRVCLPDITFNQSLTFSGARRHAQLLEFEDGHTGSDTVLYLPEDGVVFMGDLLFVRCHPWFADGDPVGLLKALKESAELKATHYVPGHGQVGTVNDVRLMTEYVERCLETAEALVDRGNVSEDTIKELPIPEPFRTWDIPRFYAANMEFLCERLKATK